MKQEDLDTKHQRGLAIFMLAIMFLLTVILSFLSQLKVVWLTFWPVMAIPAFFGLLIVRYRRQGETNLVTIFEYLAILLTFSSLFAIATYLVVEHSSSTYDAEFSVIDSYILKAPTVVRFTQSFPGFAHFLDLVYAALYFHWGLLVLYVAGIRRDNNRAFITLNRLLLASFVGLLLFGLFPAYNTTYFYGLENTYNNLTIAEHIRDIRSLKLTELRYLELLGIINFPSFHVSTQTILLIDILENERKIVKITFIPWTFLMCWSAVTVGGHYISDLFGGVFIAMLSYFVLKGLQKYRNSKKEKVVEV